MDEYISKQDAVDAVRETFKRIPTTAIRAMDTIKSLEPADVIPVKHGRWSFYDLGVFKGYICSECNRLMQFKGRFCPHCGAKMDEGE